MTRAKEIIDILTNPETIFTDSSEVIKLQEELKAEIYKGADAIVELKEIVEKLQEKLKNI